MQDHTAPLQSVSESPMSQIEAVEVEISVVLGRSVLPMSQLLRMGRGAVIPLDASEHDEVWILANNHPVARGEIQINDERIAIQVTREANASTEAPRVAEWLARQAISWLPAPCWAVVARDNTDRLTVMADTRLNPNLGPSLWAAAEWVMSHGDDLLSGDRFPFCPEDHDRTGRKSR